MHIAIFNVKYSANLGDGIIAECLERELVRRTRWTVQSIDLAGRETWMSPRSGRTRASLIAALQLMPSKLSEALLELFLGSLVRWHVLPRWRHQLKDADAAIFGGGQLIQDRDLNFPIKLAVASIACCEMRLPLCVYAVGASPPQSTKAQKLFANLLHSPQIVQVSGRDTQSCKALELRGCDPELSRDPGLLAARTWPVIRRETQDQKRIGLGITHPAILGHHGGANFKCSERKAIDRYLRIIRHVLQAGFRVVCFTNGAAEDEMLQKSLSARCREDANHSEKLEFAPRCRAPRDLAKLIGSFDGLIAHRLHAAIVAYSYAKPAIGFRWDDKLVAFFESIKRGSYVLPFDDDSGEAVIRHLVPALKEGINPIQHAAVLAEAEQGIERLIEALSKASAGRSRNAA